MRIRTPYVVLFLCFVVLGVYYPCLFAPFNSVDDTRMVNSLLNVESFSLYKILFTTGKGQYFRPLLGLTFHLDRFVWGLEESFMHLENMLLHMSNVLLVFFVTFKLYVGRVEEKRLISAIAALLFALHPINTEAVNWVSGRSDVLAGFFVLLSLLMLLFALEHEKLWKGLLAAILFLMACMSKETAMFFLPGALLIVLVHPGKSSLSSSDKKMGVRWFFCVAVTAAPGLYFLLRQMVFTQGDQGVRLAVHHALSDPGAIGNKLYIIFKVAGFYAVKLFMPLPLNFGIISVSSWYLVPGALLAVAVVYLLIRRDIISALFLTSIAIASSALIIAIAKMSWTPVAERYMYIPCAIFCVAATIVVANAARKHDLKIPLSVALVTLLAVFAFATIDRAILWQDNMALSQDTIRKSPWFGPAKNDLAVALMSHGRKEEALKIFQSNDIEKFQAASLNKVLVLIENGKLDEARLLLRERLKNPVSYQDQIIKRLISVNELIRDKSTDVTVRRNMNLEILGLLKDLHKITGDPFCYYRMGRAALASGIRAEAAEYFLLAWKGAPEGAYYKAPAAKLALDLSVPLVRSNEGKIEK